MTYSKSNYIPMVPLPNTITLGIRASTYEDIQPITTEKSTQNNSFLMLFFFWFTKLFIFYWIMARNNVMIALSEQQRDSSIHVHVSILPHNHLPSRLPHSIEQSSLCYTVAACWLSILYTAVCACPSQTP